MKYSSPSWLLSLTLSIGLSHNAIAAPPSNQGTCIDDVKPMTQLKRWYGDMIPVPVPFFLNRSPAEFYQQSRDEQPIESAPNYPLGTLFFGVLDSDLSQPNRLRVGFYSDQKQCFTELVGWIDKSSLLQGREAMRVGEAVHAYPQLATSEQARCDKPNHSESESPKTTERQEMSCDNRLFLRALSRPEFDFKPRNRPPKRGPDGETIIHGDVLSEFNLGVLKHLWRYVYAINEFDGQLWYLLGHSSYLTAQPNIAETDTNTSQDAQDTLLGWIPKYEVTEWATNVALEYNTERQALTNRFNDAEPARIYLAPREDASEKSVLAVETMALAQPAVRDGREDDTLQVRFDPFGLDPMLPRYYVKNFNEETGWYQVATIGTSKLTLSDEQLRAIMSKLRAITDDLRAVDLVFVVDRSDSMANVIAGVRTFLDQLCEQISKQRRDSHFVIQTAGGGKSLSTSLDIQVSLVAYAEESETIFSGLKLPEDREEIYRQMEFALGGQDENLYGALHQVITDKESRYWRDHALRSIVLLTDEPSSRQDSLPSVESALKESLDKPAQILAAMGQDTSQLDYRAYTPIWALFTPLNESILFRSFQNGLKKITDKRRIVDLHVRGSGEDVQKAQRQQLQKQIAEAFGELQDSINGRLRLLANRLTTVTPQAESTDAKETDKTSKETAEIYQAGSYTLISQAGLEAILQKRGISATDINAINSLAFVEGYANQQYSYHSYPTFREVIVIEAREFQILHNRIQIFVSELNNAFTRFSVCDPKSAMAAALFQALAHISGNKYWLQKLDEMNTREVCQYTRQWLMGRELENQTIAELTGIADILPVTKEGLLAMNKSDFRQMSPNLMQTHHNVLALKALCMNNILQGRTVPNEIKSCQRHRSDKKPWVYRPVGSTDKYIYLPRYLVP